MIGDELLQRLHHAGLGGAEAGESLCDGNADVTGGVVGSLGHGADRAQSDQSQDALDPEVRLAVVQALRVHLTGVVGQVGEQGGRGAADFGVTAAHRGEQEGLDAVLADGELGKVTQGRGSGATDRLVGVGQRPCEGVAGAEGSRCGQVGHGGAADSRVGGTEPSPMPFVD